MMPAANAVSTASTNASLTSATIVSISPIVAAANPDSAWAAAEELEETARLFFILEGRPNWRLGAAEGEDLQRAFGQDKP